MSEKEFPDCDWAREDDDHANYTDYCAEALKSIAEVNCIHSDQA